MTHPLPATRRGPALCLALCLSLLAGCGPQPAAPAATSGTPADRALARATRPVDAVYLLRDRLLARDGLGFARVAAPPALQAPLAAAWREGRSIWPLDELPLDARLPGMLAALQAPGAEKALMATFRRQFAGADRDIDQAVRTLALFGGEYVQKASDYTPEEREQIAQAIAALGEWGVAAPFSDPVRAERFFTALCAAARRTGIDGKAGTAAFAALGMQSSLNRMSPFLATLFDQLRRQYGLDLDASLRGLQVELMQQEGDSARLRLRYPLAGRQVDAVVPAVRIDGHWYLANYVRRARAGLPAPDDAGGPASP